jgi:hypothetical protein
VLLIGWDHPHFESRQSTMRGPVSSGDNVRDSYMLSSPGARPEDRVRGEVRRERSWMVMSIRARRMQITAAGSLRGSEPGLLCFGGSRHWRCAVSGRHAAG